MKNSTVVIWTLVICFILFGAFLWYDHQVDKKLAEQMEQKIDDVLAQNAASLKGALDSFNKIIAQKDEKISSLEVENTALHKKEGLLIAQASQQEEAVKPILEQYPEVAKLVSTLKETIATVQAENKNLREQLALTQEKFAEALKTQSELLEQNAKLTTALEDIRKDVHDALSITKREKTFGFVKDGIITGLLVYAAVTK